jgi:hypothetical protein
MIQKRFILQCILIFISSFCFAQKTIKGEVILVRPNDKESVAGKKFIYLKNSFKDSAATDSVYIDHDLRFEFKNIFKDSVTVFFKPRNYPLNVFYNIKLTGKDKMWERLKIKYSPTCPYSKDDNVCPKCHHSKKVVRIVYGAVFIPKGNKSKIKLGGCVITDCSPYWYCNKHKLRF